MAVATMRVPTVFLAIDKFSDVVTKMTRKNMMFGRSAQAAAMRTSRQLNSVGNSMLGAGIGIATGIGYAVNEAAKFEKSISNISTLTENTPAQMKYIGDRILDISKKIPVAISDMTSGMYDVVSAGITGTANQLNVLDKSSRLAVAGLGTTKEAVNIMTSSLNAFGIEASNSQQVANLLMKTVKYGKTTVSGISESFGAFASIMKNSNVSLEEYLAGTAALTTTGMSMSRAQTQFSSATIALIKPNKTMAKLLANMGAKDIPEFIKQNGGLVNTLGLVAEKAKLLKIRLGDILGRKEGLSAAQSLLGAQKEKFKEIMTDMASGADILNTAFAKQQETLSAKIQLMKNQMTNLAIRIGEILIPRLNGLLDSVLPIIENFSVWNQKNNGLVNTLMSVAKWLLIFGIYAKVASFALRGYAFAISAVTWLSETYTAVTRLLSIAQLASAVSGQSLAVVLWELVVAEWAALAPILLVVAALGLLTYAFWDLGDSTDRMVGSQISSLDKGNMAWVNSTKVMSEQLQKQKALLDNAVAKQKAPISKNKFYDEASKLDPMSPNFDVQKFNELHAKGKQFSKENFTKNILPKFAKKEPDYLKRDGFVSPENLAGKRDLELERMYKFAAKERDLNIKISTEEGLKAKTEGDIPSGINPVLTPNQGARGK